MSVPAPPAGVAEAGGTSDRRGMLRVRMADAQAGMELAMPVVHPESTGTLLLKPGHQLNEHTLRGLRELRVREVWIRYPALESLRRFVSEEVAAGCRELARRIAGAIDALVVDRDAPLDYAAYRMATGGVIGALAKSPTAALYIMEMADARAAPVRHAANVCFLSLLIGLRLSTYLEQERRRLPGRAARDLTSLGVGALLHDVGMLELDEETLARWERTGDESDEGFRAHVHLGSEIVHAPGSECDATAAAVVLHHHQRFDGSGFPTRVGPDGIAAGLKGREAHVFARIVAVADAFDRERFGRGTRRRASEEPPPIPAVRALRHLLEPDVRARFDPVVLRGLLAVTPAYPPGSMVTLSDGRRGAVTDWSPLDPCRPTVEVLDPKDWRRREEDRRRVRVDLAKRRELSIVEIDGHDVRGDNFYPGHEHEFDPVFAMRAGSDGSRLAG